MKKLLLYLVAIITMSTLSVDAMADKYVYIQKPADGNVTLWWWGSEQNYSADFYNWPGPDLTNTEVNLKDSQVKSEYPKVDSLTGTDGNAYYKVGLQDGTTKMILNGVNNGDITIDFNYCYNTAGGTIGLVSEIIKEQGGEDPAIPAVVTLRYPESVGSATWKNFSEDVKDGVVVFEKVALGGANDAGFNLRYRYDANSDNYFSMPNHAWVLTSTPLSFEESFKQETASSGDGVYQTVENADKNKYYDITLNFNDLTYTIVEHVEVVDPVIKTEYTWAAKESAEKAFELVLKEGVYTLSNALSNVPQAFYLECTKKVYVDDVEDESQKTTTVYGWTNHSGLEPNGEITLWKENDPITFAEGYENFNLSFAHVEGTPDNVKINFTATKEVKVEMPQVVSIKTFKSQDGDKQNWDFDIADVKDGVCVIEKVYLSGGFNFRFRYDKNTEEYHSVSGENNTWNVTSEPTSFANFFNVIDCGDDGKWQKVNGASSGVYYDITFNFNDLTYTIVEHVEQVEPSKVTTVYFIDRQGWGNLHCYNYSDKGLKPDGSGNVTNGEWPGQAMEDITENEKYENLIAGIQGMDNAERGYRVYKIDLTSTELDDQNNYTLPKIIFAGGRNGEGKTTEQTYNLYLVNNGIYTNGTAKTVDGQIAIKASDYLPRQWYDPTAEKGEQCVFIYPNAEANTDYAYIYVDVDAYTKAYIDGEKVSVQVEVGEGDNKFIATGRSGTHYLSLVTINGKDYLRVAIAEDVVPEGTPVKLVVWIGDKSVDGDVLSPQVAYDSKWSSCKHPDCNNDTDKTLHEDCPMDSRCPLIFTDVEFVNGALFTRSAEQENIITKTLPTRMYLIDAADNGAFDLAGLEDMKTVLGDDYIAYDVTSTLVNGEYVIPNVPQKAKFFMLGAYDTDEEGEVATVYHIFSNSNNPEMLPGNNYPFRYDEEGTYTITDDFGTAREYTITIHWADQVVSVRTEAKPNAFQLGQNRDNGGYVGVNSQVAHFMFAVADDAVAFDEIHIMHASEFDPDFHKENHSVTFAPTEDYDVFMKGALNKEVGEGDYDKTLTNAESGATSTHSYLKARAYTAGIYTLNVSNEDADLITAASSDIPVRVIPTLESTGLTINYHAIPSSSDGSFVIDLDELTGDEFNDDKYSYGPERVGFFPTLADYQVDGKQDDEVLQIWWAYLSDVPAQNRAASAYSAVNAYNGLKATENPFGTPAENGLARYSYVNAMSNDAMKAAKGFQFQIVQNGITSPLYTVNVSDNIGTGVDELGVEEGEAVYYDLNGVKVDGTNLAKGIYVKVVGTKATKVFVK